MSGQAFWITGIPGSGKSTIAVALKALFPDFVILSMDELRTSMTPEPTYLDAERDMVYRCIVSLAKKLTELNHPVIIDATGHKRRWREHARKEITHYAEIYLNCPLETGMQRERMRLDRHGAPEHIYQKGEEGWPVPGIAVPYEVPLQPELEIDTENKTVQDTVAEIQHFLLKRL